MIRHPCKRHGAAAVEFAFIFPLLLLLMVGVWEAGRMIEVQQIISNAAYEGARVAAQGQTVNTLGAYQQIKVTGSNPSVTDTVRNYLTAAQIYTKPGPPGPATTPNVPDTTLVTFTNMTSGGAQPFQANKEDVLQITVTVPYQNIQWSPILIFGTNLTSTWYINSVVDDPFQIVVNPPIWNGFPDANP
jgi:Flp pilus assembly protein TadG